MSMKTLPLLFINLGGEMLYILDQRLKAQNIPKEKAKKVMHDITGTMFNKRFMEELFKPQELYSKKAMRTVFDRLAHASIMRLNSASMDKLYDLMTMAFKYQVSLCLSPNEILLITLNHMDAIRGYVDDKPAIHGQVQHVYGLLHQHFAKLSMGEFMLVRQTLLNFFQDMHIRVSIFLKDKVQNSNGRFVLPVGGAVPAGFEVPGTIRTYDSRGKENNCTQFNPGAKYSKAVPAGSYDIRGDRVTKLGTNMYSISRPAETSFVSKSSSSKAMPVPEAEPLSSDPQAKAQLDLLSKLIGGGESRSKSAKPEFRLNLYGTDEEEEQAAALRPMVEPGSQVVNIDASKKKQSAALNRIMGELRVDDNDGDEDDLLDLMDSASK